MPSAPAAFLKMGLLLYLLAADRWNSVPASVRLADSPSQFRITIVIGDSLHIM